MVSFTSSAFNYKKKKSIKRKKKGGSEDLCKLYQDDREETKGVPFKQKNLPDQIREANEYCRVNHGNDFMCIKRADGIIDGCVNFQERFNRLSQPVNRAPDALISRRLHGGRRRKSRRRTNKKKKSKKSRKSRKSKKSKKSRKSRR